MSEIGAVIKMQHTLIRQGSKPDYDGSSHCMKFPEQEIHMPTLIETPEQNGEQFKKAALKTKRVCAFHGGPWLCVSHGRGRCV